MIDTTKHWDRVRAGTAAVAIAAGVGAMALAACAEDEQSPSSAAITTPGGGVHGYAAVRPGQRLKSVRQPGVSAYLKNPTTGVLVGPKIATDAHGRYELPPQAPGPYLLCIEGFGVTTNCSPIMLTQETYNPPGDRVLSPTGGVVWGNVLLADGKSCYHENAGMGAALTTTRVSLLDAIGRNVTRPVTANDRGQYLLSGITGSGTFTVRAECAGSTADRPITFAPGFTGNPYDLTFPNHSPIAVSIIGKVAGVPVRRASAGDLVDVTLTAHDSDGDPLHYLWSDGTSGLVPVDAPTIAWQVPTIDATAIMFVEVSDGRGGFARTNLALSTTTANPLFSGTAVSASTGAPLAGARVNVNGGAAVTTDGLGRFQLRGSQSSRYAINATLSRFALASRIYYGPATGVVLRMAATERTVCDPNKLCTARTKEQAAVRVVIAPGTLRDKRTGKPPDGMVNIDIANFDLARTDAMPGDFSALDRSDRAVALISNGAVNVDISDNAGNKFTLATGTTARLSIPVDPSVLARGAPGEIPLWEFEEATGLWLEKATARFNRDTASFEGDVPGFSVWNADTVFTDDACIRFTMDPARQPPFPFILHISFPVPAGPVRHNDFTITENVNGLFRLPADTAVTFEIHPASGPDAVLSSLTVDSGPAIDPVFGGFPPFDFTECHGFDPASALPGQPVRLGLDIPNHTAPWLSPSLFAPFGVGNDAETRAYYNTIAGVTIDPITNACTPPPAPAANRCDLTGFQTANGFATDYATTFIPALGEIVTYFYNAGDLGLGREMHCKKTGANLACYVTNYGVPFPPAAEPVSALASAIGHIGPIASVAMEYDAAAPANEQVRFYVYPAGGTLALKAALDSEGPKNVPQLCIACHGGSYNPVSHKALGTAFREFDVHSYLYDATTWTLSNQQENFRRLNEMVRSTSPNFPLNSNDPIRTLIDRMYDTCGGVSTPGCIADTTDLPSAWNGDAHKQNLYNQIVKQYCRACHVAQSSFLDWTSPINFTSLVLESPMCLNYDMPHGEVPFRKFWLSTNPSGPVFLADPVTGVGIAGGCPR
jgi:hypothetical protein